MLGAVALGPGLPAEVTKNAPTSKLQRALRKALVAEANPERASQQQAYMRSNTPFYGLTAGVSRALAKQTFDRYPIESARLWQAQVLGLWRGAKAREERHAAIELAIYKPYRQWLTADAWEMLDELVITGAWWDFIDAIAPNHHAWLLANEPKVIKPKLRAYASDTSTAEVWRRRVALLCQLKAKHNTDEALLYGSIRKSLGHPEFFVRKAIGWALRAHSRIDPAGVLEFVGNNKDRLSPLSKREALKLLLKSGQIKTIP